MTGLTVKRTCINDKWVRPSHETLILTAYAESHSLLGINMCVLDGACKARHEVITSRHEVITSCAKRQMPRASSHI